MQKEYFLSELLPNQQATVKKILAQNTVKERLRDFGFIQGSVIECVFSASSGDPICYRVGETLLAIRKKDAHSILITKRRRSYET